MKKIKIISIGLVVFLLSFSIVKAFNVDSKLKNVWNNRKDLQKIFPNSEDEKLEEWAKKYGWKEDESLFEYNPYGEAVNEKMKEIIDEQKIINDYNYKTLNEKIDKIDSHIYDVSKSEYDKNLDYNYLSEISKLETKINELTERINNLSKQVNINSNELYNKAGNGKFIEVCIDIDGRFSFGKQEDTGYNDGKKNEKFGCSNAPFSNWGNGWIFVKDFKTK